MKNYINSINEIKSTLTAKGYDVFVVSAGLQALLPVTQGVSYSLVSNENKDVLVKVESECFHKEFRQSVDVKANEKRDFYAGNLSLRSTIYQSDVVDVLKNMTIDITGIIQVHKLDSAVYISVVDLAAQLVEGSSFNKMLKRLRNAGGFESWIERLESIQAVVKNHVANCLSHYENSNRFEDGHDRDYEEYFSSQANAIEYDELSVIQPEPEPEAPINLTIVSHEITLVEDAFPNLGNFDEALRSQLSQRFTDNVLSVSDVLELAALTKFSIKALESDGEEMLANYRSKELDTIRAFLAELKSKGTELVHKVKPTPSAIMLKAVS